MANRSTKRFPAFFKVCLPEHSYNSLKIPDAFIAWLSRLIPEKVTLSNKKGKLWSVDVGYSDKGVFFLNGWQTFVKDYLLDTGDFLVLQYNGDCRFNAKIFGRSGCEKRTSNIVEVKVENEEEENNEENEEDYEDNIFLEDDDNSSVNDENYIEEEEEDEDYIAEEEEGQEDTKEQEGKEDAKEEATRRRRGKKKISVNNGWCKKKAKAVGSKATNDATGEEVEIREYIQCLNPYFVSKAGLGDRKNLLLVPSHVLKDFGLELVKRIILLDEHGRKWPGKLVLWKDG